MNKKSALLLLLVFTTTSSLTALNSVLADSVDKTEPTSVEGTRTQKASMPIASVGVVDGKIYAIGGEAASGDPTDANQMYDPETDTWQTDASMPTARNNAKATVANGLIYVVGGSSNATINEAYNPETATWSSKEAVMYIEETNQTTEIYKVTRLGDSTVVSLDGEMYWIGTLWDPTKGNIRTNFMLTYNQANDS